ncbi:putative DNA-binding transcriptional regulator AlpA [Variovorax sp. W1I1]|uniref:helix-turn-helix transcriptional regulator n=1 Tax=Variovorax sp. W1I1 TaxID=3042309 RepID=UPI002780505F|nr:AlpA family phage regulatory protein [Variovorax sp. W1I1]MDQ0606015.1 putative DNA-binding transcriptional regulator AlpA [Variovorax sp. W1I1]
MDKNAVLTFSALAMSHRSEEPRSMLTSETVRMESPPPLKTASGDRVPSDGTTAQHKTFEGGAEHHQSGVACDMQEVTSRALSMSPIPHDPLCMLNSDTVHMNSQVALKLAPGDRFLKIHDVERRVCLKKSAIYARMSAGSFPRSISLGRRCTVWLKSSIDGWMAEQIEAANHLAACGTRSTAKQAPKA